MANHSRAWSRNQAIGFHLRTTAIVAEYAVGAGGRICDLPARYLDAVAEAIIRRHPQSTDVRIVELMLGGRYRRSIHPLLRDVTLAEFRLRRCADSARYYRRRNAVRRGKPRKLVTVS